MSIAEEKIEIITNDEWLSSLKTRIAKTKWVVGRTGGPTIFKVPRIFQEADPKAYEPKMVSLGPYHHGNIHLKAMEDLKWHYLKEFLGRNPDKPLEDYIDQIKEREHEARMAYSEKVDMTSDEFAQMMLLDCCFVIEIIHLWKTYVERQEKEEDEEEEEAVDKQIRCSWPWFRTARPMHSVAAQPRPLMHSVAMRPTLFVLERPMTMFGNQLRTDEKGTEAEHNPITSTRYTLPVVVRDMLMLENQLPFFLLETLFHSAFPKSPDRLNPNIGDVKVHHILHLLHYCIDPSKTRDGGKPSSSRWHKPNRNNFRRSRGDNHPTPLLKWIPSATQLMEAGVHFRKKKEATNFLDITFQNGEMEISLLQVDDDTNTLFRNLIAFEQCFKNVSLHVTTYAALMDCIINTAADVALLQQHGIILSGLGDGKQVANLFNQLCKEVTLDYEKSYVSGIYKDVNKHCATEYNQWRARLNHDYFSNPWAVISVFAAILLFVLTITQTIYSALSYVRPPN